MLGFSSKQNKILHLSKSTINGRTLLRVLSFILPVSLIIYVSYGLIANDINLTGVQEESFGYRYFYSLRWMYSPKEFIWLPQGQLAGVLHHIYNLLLSAMGYSAFDPTVFLDRSQLFMHVAIIGSGLLFLVSLFLLLRKIQYPELSLILGIIWLLPLFSRSSFYIVVADYHPLIVVLAILNTALALHILPDTTSPSWKLGLIVGVLAGLSLTLKFTMVAFPATLVILLLLFKRWQWQNLIKTLFIIGSATILVTSLVLLGQYLRSVVYLAQILEAIYRFSSLPGASVPIQGPKGYLEFVQWVLTSGSLPYGFLTLLPLTPLVVFLLIRSQTGLKLAATFLPGCLAYSFMLYLRPAPVTILEMLAFFLFMFSIVLVIWWKQLQESVRLFLLPTSYLRRFSMIVFIIIAIWLYSNYLLTTRGVLANQLPASNQVKSVWQATSTLPGKTLFLIPDNDHRVSAVETAIFKGGSEIFTGQYNSRLLRQIFPDRDYLATVDPRANTINFNDYDYLIYNFNDYVRDRDQINYRQILEEIYQRPFNDWHLIRKMRLLTSDLLIFGKLRKERLSSRSDLRAFYLSETGPEIKAGVRVSITPELEVTLENGDLIYLESTLLKITPEGLVEQIGEQGQRARLINIGLWNQESRRFQGLDAVYGFGRWFIDTNELEPVNVNPYFVNGSKDNPLPGYQVHGMNGSYKIIQMEDETGTFVRVEALSDVDQLAIELQYLNSEFIGVPITVRGQIRARGEGVQALQVPGQKSDITGLWTPLGEQWTTLMIRVDQADYSDNTSGSITLGVYPMRQGDWFDVRELALFAGRLPDQSKFGPQNMAAPEFLAAQSDRKVLYLPTSFEDKLRVGLSVSTNFLGDISTLKLGDLVLVDNKLIRIDQNQITPMLGGEGQTVWVDNVGPWDESLQRYSGLPAVFQNDKWMLNTSSLEAINPKPDFLIKTDSDPIIPGYWISPNGAHYKIFEMNDEMGPFLRIQAIQDISHLVLTGQTPLTTLDNSPVSLKAQVRASKPQTLTLFDMIDSEESKSYTAINNNTERWNTLVISGEVVTWPNSSDNYSIGLFDVKAGDWFDIRELSVYVGRLP